MAPARATTVQTQAVVSMPATFTTVKSDAIFAEAQLLMPGGVSSPVRAFKSVGGGPVVFDRVKGAYAWDVDGNKYVDYIGTWGMLALSHSTTSSVHNCPPTSHGTSRGEAGVSVSCSLQRASRPQGRERMDSPTLQTLQDPILLLQWV